jgi:glycosyltransferase involved in cell wall biosynthesis
VIVTSPATARTLSSDFGVAPDRITVVLPGTARAPASPGSPDGIVRLVAVGSVIPRKGFDVLANALAHVKDLPWHLSIAGDTTRDAATATALREQVVRLGLTDRITMLGTLSSEALDRVYGASDAFVLASHYEGYGMAYAEALAHGLPVIGTTGGAIADTVPPQAGILVEPGHVDALAQALATLIGNASRRAQLAAGARTAAANLPTWPQSCALFSGALDRACTG